MIKIKVLNDSCIKLSPYAFGTLFSNINEYTIVDDVYHTFANVGIHKNMIIQDILTRKYTIKNIVKNDDNYIVELFMHSL